MTNALKSYEVKRWANIIVSVSCFIMSFTSYKADVAFYITAGIFISGLITAAYVLLMPPAPSNKTRRYRCDTITLPTQGQSIFLSKPNPDYPLWILTLGPQIKTTDELGKLIEIIKQDDFGKVKDKKGNVKTIRKSITWERKIEKGWYIYKLNDENVYKFKTIVLNERQMLRFVSAFNKCQNYHNRYKPEWCLWQLERQTSARLLGSNFLYRMRHRPESFKQKTNPSPTLGRRLNVLRNRG